MEKMHIKDKWGKKDLILSLSHKKDMVGIGEKLDENIDKFLHIDIGKFEEFALNVLMETGRIKKEADVYISRMQADQLLKCKIQKVTRTLYTPIKIINITLSD